VKPLVAASTGLATAHFGDLSQPQPLLGYRPPVPPLQWIRRLLGISEAFLGLLTVADGVGHRKIPKEKACQLSVGRDNREKTLGLTRGREIGLPAPGGDGSNAKR